MQYSVVPPGGEQGGGEQEGRGAEQGCQYGAVVQEVWQYGSMAVW